jgi:hypothetical protein
MDIYVTIIVGVVLTAVCVFIFTLWRTSRKTHESIREVAHQHNLIRHDESARMLCRAIHTLNPDAAIGIDYSIRHDDPKQEPYISEWTASVSRPSEEDIKATLLEISDVNHEKNFAAMRRREYPSVEEQLDAAYQARQGDITKQLEIDEKIRLVKEKYPKGEECF